MSCKHFSLRSDRVSSTHPGRVRPQIVGSVRGGGGGDVLQGEAGGHGARVEAVLQRMLSHRHQLIIVQ